MNMITNKQFEKIKLFQLAKQLIRKDYSFEFTPDHLIYHTDTGKEKLYQLLKNESTENLFTVTVRKNDISELYEYLPKRLLEIEWGTQDLLTLRMVNRPIIKDEWSEQVYIKLGKPISLPFHDFQICSDIPMDHFLRWVNSDEKHLSTLVQACRNEDNSTKMNKLLQYSDFIERTPAPQGGHYVSPNLSIENFLFENDRISRYCSAVDDVESLDFALTYRQNDILTAIKRGEDSFKQYLKNCAVIKVTKKALPVILSWKYPSCLREYLTFLIKLESSHPADSANDVERKKFRDTITSELNRAFKRRNDVPIRNCLTALNDLKGRCSKKIESAIKKLEKDVVTRFDQDISAEEKAKAYDRAFATDKYDLAQRWNNEDFLRFSGAYSTLIGINACKKIVKFVKIMRESTFLKDFPLIQRLDEGYWYSSLQRLDEGHSSFLCFPYILGTLFASAKPEDKGPLDPNSAKFAANFIFSHYFLNATWDKGRPIESMDDRGNQLKSIYDTYIRLNFKLEGLSAFFACIPAVYENFQIIIKHLADIEAFALKKMLDSGMLSECLSIGADCYALLPYNHWLLIKEYQNAKLEEEKQKLEQEKRDLELKSQTQKEIFTNLNHSIKNLVMSVTKTLDRAKQEELSLPVRRMINRASQGADLISSIARAISFSYRDSENLWKKDINVSTSASPMDQIILSALFHSVPNILSGENLANYRYECERYFPRKEDFELAEKEWYQASNASLKQEWINKFLFPLQLNLDASLKNLLIDDEHATTTNFFILFNEIFLNTIKALAYVDKDARECKVYMTFYNNTLIFDLINTAASDRTQNKNGFGHILIENYRKMFNIEIFDETFEPAEKKYKLHFELPLV